MEQKFFLEKNRSKFSNNVEGAMNLALSTKTRLLPNDNVVDNFSLFEQYNRERDECFKYRLILNVNPVCSNVLYNARTEIVLNEGSSDCKLLIGSNTLDKNTYAPKAVNTTSNINYYSAIRNTEYSHKDNGGFIYHCGYDIFNNHMLRKKGFVHVNPLDKNKTNSENYNTILDYCRDGRGEIVEEEIGVSVIRGKKGEKTKMHLYQYDTIMSMPTAFADNCIEKDGWWGFTNPNTIEIPNSNDKNMSINRMMANNKSCEFIDLYPDRSLYSFIPKFNKHRMRVEKNWDYCITYPYKSDYELVDTVCGGENQAIKANIKYGVNTSSQPIVICSSYFKHNLKPGDYVTFFYYMPHSETKKNTEEELKYVKTDKGEYLFEISNFDEDGNVKDETDYVEKIISKDFCRYGIKVKVESIGDANGDNLDRVFTVKYNNIDDIYEYLNYFGCFYKKNVSNTDCLYYFRKFKKLKKLNGDSIKSEVNKIAFSRNIYGDDVAQVIFTDDLNIEGLLDNNGKPLTEIYFTVIKRNAGRSEWYNDKNYGSEKVEFSHCFGKLTSGIDFCGIDDEPFDYNIHYLHNMDSTMIGMSDAKYNTFSAWGETILSGMPQTIENDITIDFDEFYGDVVEYDISKATETVIGNVFHRFNTEQRETWNQDFQHIKQDAITSDDYDDANGTGNAFKVETYFLNNVKNSIDTSGSSGNMMYGNISPEGYYYNPHMRIKLKENDSIVSTSIAKSINYTNPNIESVKKYLLFKEDGTIETYSNRYDAENAKNGDELIVLQDYHYDVTITAPVNYGFYKGDYIAFYHKNTSSIVWGEIVKVNNLDITIRINGVDMEQYGIINKSLFDPYSAERVFYAFWSENNTPIYAKYCEGNKKFVWRNIIQPSKLTQDSDLYDNTFANGCFYIEKNVNFFVKRQDPIGKYGLSMPMYKVYKQSVSNPLLKFVIRGYNPVDLSEVMFIMNNLTDNCY